VIAERDIIMIGQKKLKLLHIIHKVLEGAITQAKGNTVHLIMQMNFFAGAIMVFDFICGRSG
jgi:hypothetical protein